MSAKVLEKLANVPKEAGIYLWKNSQGEVIYVGKAKNLNRRMHQYFEGALNSYKTSKLVQEISDFEIIVLNSDKEALLLERNLIEENNPIYNILLLDDRRYPYLKIELLNNKLNISVSRHVKKQEKSNVFYFGPFPNGYGLNIILKLLQREAFYEKGLKIESNDKNFWLNQFNKIKSILRFDNHNYIKDLKAKMLEAAKHEEQLEIALDLRNSIEYLTKLNEEQIIELKDLKDLDVIAYKTDEKFLYITVLFYRYGILINKDNQYIPLSSDLTIALEQFFKNYYANKIIPSQILVQNSLLELDLNLPEGIKLFSPKIGTYKKILNVAEINLENFYNEKHLIIESKIVKTKEFLEKLSELVPNVNLDNIIVFDNSNLNNTNSVGVAVVYTKGFKNKNLYRKFNHSVDFSRQADVEYMYESIKRYFLDQKNKKDFGLLIVDGGKPQVSEAKKTLKELDLNIPVIGLVKDDFHRTKGLINLEQEEIQIKDKALLNFLAEIQIEVDRFAKSHFRKRQKISSLEGKLQSIQGLGPKMEQKLLHYFGNYSNIYNATIEELKRVVPENIAKKIYNKEMLERK